MLLLSDDVLAKCISYLTVREVTVLSKTFKINKTVLDNYYETVVKRLGLKLQVPIPAPWLQLIIYSYPKLCRLCCGEFRRRYGFTCDGCRIQKITKTDAKKKYLLTEDELENLEREYRQNPHGRHAPLMTLFTESDVRACAIQKFGSMSNLSALKTEKELKKLKRKKRRTRPQMLQAELDKYGLEIRGDSLLTNDYLQRGIGTPAEIAKVMHEMDWYFKYTDYPQIRDDLIEHERNGDNDSDDDYYPYHRNYDTIAISAQAKQIALARWLKVNHPPYLNLPVLILKVLSTMNIETHSKLV